MAAARLSRLQKRSLCGWPRSPASQGVIAHSHQALVRTLQGDPGNISHRVRILEARNLLVLGRSSGGKAEDLRLTPEGQKGAMQCAGSCDSGIGSVET